MSIASQLQALEGNIGDAYDMVAQRGGTMPQRKNMENLDDAIATIPSATTYSAGNGIDITGTTISIDDTVVAELSDLPGVMSGATSSTAGNSGLVPAPAAGDEDKVLTGAGTWNAVAQPPLFGYVKESFLMGGGGPGNYIGRDASGAQGLLSAIDIKNALAQGRSVFLMSMENGSVSSVCQVLCFSYNRGSYGAISWIFNGSPCLAEALENVVTWTVY